MVYKIMARLSRSSFGVTLLETLVAVSIMTMIGAVILASLNNFRAQKTMDAAVEEVLAAFSQAHFDTISSRNDQQYGVHIDTDKVTYFVGPTYTAGTATNVIYRFVVPVEIVNVSLAGGGNDVLFDRLTGGTSESGTFVIRAKANSTLMTTVTINGTGAISI